MAMPASAPAPHSASAHPSAGLAYACGAYLIWGTLPLYMQLVRHVPPLEFVAWRVLFALPLCLLLVVGLRQTGELRAALRNRPVLLALTGSALLIAINWSVFVVAVLHGHVLATSLGYYINPLVNVLLGTLFLRERLGARQWTAVGLAMTGVALLAWNALPMLWISLSLALSFASYGLVRKLVSVSALPGLTVETIVLMPLAAGYLAYAGRSAQGLSFGADGYTTLLLAGAGVVTAVPLLLFAAAARRLEFSTLGFIQYLSPTITFLLGLSVFHEPLRPVQLGSFALIWLAIAVFTWDLLARRSHAARAAA